MSIRVNLLAEDEIRYYSAVSKGFAIRAGVIGLVLFAVLFSLIFGWRVKNVKEGLKQSRAEWKELEPRYEQYKKLKERLDRNETLVSELSDWKQMKLLWDGPLLRIQMLVPKSIQLTGMNVQSEFAADISRTKIGKGEDAEELVTISPTRTYKVSISGQAEGGLADEEVVKFVRALGNDEELSVFLESVKLQGLRKGLSPDSRDFTLVAKTVSLGEEK